MFLAEESNTTDRDLTPNSPNYSKYHCLIKKLPDSSDCRGYQDGTLVGGGTGMVNRG